MQLELGDYETLEAARKICDREARERMSRIGPVPHVMLLTMGAAIMEMVLEWANGTRRADAS